jgi:hypothetical protein
LKEEIKRINKLVAEGKLSPEDAADLIDAFYQAEAGESETPPPPPPPKEAFGEAANQSSESNATEGHSKSADPFKSVIEAIERLGKEVTENVDWKKVSEDAKQGAKKGLDALKTGLDEVTKGKFNLGWLLSTSTREIRLPLALASGQVLRIENGAGDVEVSTDTTESYVIAKAKIRGATPEDAKAKADAYSLVVDSSEHSVDIRQPQVSGLDVDLKIVVAATPAVEIKSEAGDVTVRDTKNACRIRSMAGEVMLIGLNGQIEVVCDSGDVNLRNSESTGVVIENKAGNIELTGVHGNMNLRSATGNISVHGSSGKTLSIEAVSGNIFVETDQPITGTLNIRTVNGNADVHLPDGSDARVAVTTLRGVASTAVELEDRAQNDQRITGRLGNGSGSIDISAVTGNVNLSLKDSSGGTTQEPKVEWGGTPDFS